VESYDKVAAGCFTAQKFLGIEGPVVCFAIGPFVLVSDKLQFVVAPAATEVEATN
jgi:hypothetical protein